MAAESFSIAKKLVLKIWAAILKHKYRTYIDKVFKVST